METDREYFRILLRSVTHVEYFDMLLKSVNLNRIF